MLFQGWAGLLRVILIGPPMNAFDLITISIGSIFATVLLSKELDPGRRFFVAFALVILMQHVVSWFSLRSLASGVRSVADFL